MFSSKLQVPTALPVAPIKAQSKEFAFQVLTGSAAILLDALEASASGGILGFAACAPQACQEIYLGMGGSRLEAGKEKVGTHRRSRPAHQRRQARMRLQQLLWRPRSLAADSSYRAGTVRD